MTNNRSILADIEDLNKYIKENIHTIEDAITWILGLSEAIPMWDRCEVFKYAAENFLNINVKNICAFYNGSDFLEVSIYQTEVGKSFFVRDFTNMKNHSSYDFFEGAIQYAFYKLIQNGSEIKNDLNSDFTYYEIPYIPRMGMTQEEFWFFFRELEPINAGRELYDTAVSMGLKESAKNDIEIRESKKTDYEEIMNLFNSINEDDKKFLALEFKLNAIKQNVRNGRNCFVAVLGKEIVGFMRESGMPEGHTVLEEILVNPNYRGKGIARQLINHFHKLHPSKTLAKSNPKNEKIRGLLLSTGYTIDDPNADRVLKWTRTNIKNESTDMIFNEAVSISSKRKKVEELILKTFSLIDPTGSNTKKQKDFFKSMNDKQFDTWFKDFAKNPKDNFYMELVPYKNEPTLKEIKDAADFLKVPLEEYVYFRHDGNKENPIRTRDKVPVGFLPIKRLQQILSKKNSFSLDINVRNAKTG
jgi:GNAT superfamily N-acetyltransferase